MSLAGTNQPLAPTRPIGHRLPPPALVWLARLIACVAIALACYLLWATAAAEGRVAGCGGAGGDDCAGVLNSRWSSWLGMPVGLPATFIYLAFFGVLFGVGPDSHPRSERDAWRALLPLATLAAGAASWFSFLQLFVLHSVCLYCMSLHACGLALALFVFWFMPLRWSANDSAPRDMAAISPLLATMLMLAGLGGVGLLVAGQLLMPAPDSRLEITEMPDADSPTPRAPAQPAGAESRGHVADAPQAPTESQADLADGRTLSDLASGNVALPDGPPAAAPVARRPGRQLSIMGGKATIDLADVPVLGSADAPHMIVELFDYTCPQCRKLHPLVRAARENFGDQLAVVVLPNPMNKTCNPYVAVTDKHHVLACKYARLALAVWYAKPADFEEYHEWLMDSSEIPPLADARRKAVDLIGDQALDQRLAGNQVDRRIAEDTRIYHLAGDGVIPKLIGPKFVAVGLPPNLQSLRKMLEQHFGVK